MLKPDRLQIIKVRNVILTSIVQYTRSENVARLLTNQHNNGYLLASVAEYATGYCEQIE